MFLEKLIRATVLQEVMLFNTKSCRMPEIRIYISSSRIKTAKLLMLESSFFVITIIS